MSARLFVGNLSFSLAEDVLMEIFARVGPVSHADIVRDRYDGRSRGFGFVEMTTAEDGPRAVSALNGVEAGGRPMRVELAISTRPAQLRRSDNHRVR